MAPERPFVGGFPLAHSENDLVGGGNTEDVNNNSSFSYATGAISLPGIKFGDFTINIDGSQFPTDPILGQVVYVAGVGKFYYWDGTDWLEISLASGGTGTGLFVGVVGYDGTDLYYWDGDSWDIIDTIPEGTVRNNAGVLEYRSSGAWTSLGDSLPTSDPGSGGLWLSAT